MTPDDVSRSKLLSLVLRHAPHRLGLVLDAEGWAQVDALLHAVNASGRRMSREDLERVVRGNDKQRFAFSEDGSRIRARQGHSLAVDLKLEPRTPPERLFHGTATRFLDAIRREGLQPRARQLVHLSATRETAEAVGARHGRPVVLEVDAARMHCDGQVFHCAENGVWLTGAVPAAYLRFPN